MKSLFTPSDCRNEPEKFWVERPGDLLTHFNIIPIYPKSREQLYNTITRVIIIIFFILLMLRVKRSLYFLIIALLVVIFVYYNTKPVTKHCKEETDNIIEGYEPINHMTYTAQEETERGKYTDNGTNNKVEYPIYNTKENPSSPVTIYHTDYNRMKQRSQPVEKDYRQNNRDLSVMGNSSYTANALHNSENGPIMTISTRQGRQYNEIYQRPGQDRHSITTNRQVLGNTSASEVSNNNDHVNRGISEREYVISTSGHDPRSALPAVSMPQPATRPLKESVQPALEAGSLPKLMSREEADNIRKAAKGATSISSSSDGRYDSTSFARKNKALLSKPTYSAESANRLKPEFVRKGRGEATIHVQHRDAAFEMMDEITKEDREKEVYYQSAMQESEQTNAINILHG